MKHSIRYFLLLFCAFSFLMSDAQNVNIGTPQYTTCHSNFYDAGGPAGYAGYDYKITTVGSADGKCLAIIFSQFDLGFGAELKIYQGANVTSGILIGSFSGNSIPPVIESPILTFEYIPPVMNMGNIPGWEAHIKCVTCTGNMVRTDPASDCSGAIPLCSNQTVIVSTNQYDDTGNEDDDVGSCFSGTGNGGSVWYTFSPQANGNLDFYINPSGSTDYDFVLYDATNGCNNLQEMSCNFSATYGNTGMTTNASDYQNSYMGCNGNEYNSAPQDCGVWNESEAVNTTHTYMLMVNFYGGSNDGFTLQFQNDPGTVSIMDNTPPIIANVTQPGCNGSEIHIDFSENLDCSTLQASDFTLTGYTITIVNSNCVNGMTNDILLNITPSLPPGTFNLQSQTVSDMCGNLLNDDFTFTISNTTVNVTVSGTDFCAGSSSTLTTAVTGVAPLTYTWGDGSHNSTLTVTTAGNYCVTVSDACGSSANDCQIINSISAPVINTLYICNGSNASLSVTGCTGTIQWQEWGNVPSSTPITNASECTACGGTPTLIFGIYISCSIGSSCPTTVPGWVNIGTAATITENPPYASQYQAICTGGGGCNAQSVVLVDCNTPLTVSVNSATVCTGNCANITATPSGGTAPITYAWSTGGFTGAGPHNVCPTGTTTYTVTATDAGGITAIASGIVTVNQSPPVNAGLDVSICTGNSTIITATGADTYSWNNGLGAGSSHTVSPAATTTYSVTGTDANNCTATDVITVTVGANLTPTIIGNLIICNGNSTSLDVGTGFLSYYWSTGANTQNINVTTSGNYSVTVTGTGGCTGSASVNVTVNPCTEICDNGIDDDGDGLIDLNDTTDCNCLGINISQQSSLIPNHSFEQMNCCPNSYSQVNCATGWIQATDATSDYQNTCGLVFGSVADAGLVPFPDGNGILGCINAQGWQEYVGSCLTATMTAGNSYEMTFDIATVLMDMNGDTPQNIVPGGINGLENIDVTIYGNPSCGAMPINTVDCPSSADPSWIELGHINYDPVSQWGLITIVFSPTIDINAIIMGSPCTLPGTWIAATNNYSNYVYTIFDDLMLQETTHHSFNLLSAGNLCTNNLILYAQLSDTISNYQWQWYKNGVALVGEINDTLYFSQNNYTSGEYEVRFTVNSDCEIQSITINPIIVTANAGADIAICLGDSAILTATGGDSYHWNTGQDTATITVTPIITSVYFVTVTDNNGCTDRDSVTVTVNQNTSANAGNDTAICLGLSTMLNATGGNTYHWSNGDSTVSITVSPTATTNYSVTTIDGNGCIDSDSVTVTINQNTSAYVENANICNGDTATLIASGGISYLWSNGSNSASTTVHPVLTTVYILTATDNNGCSDTASVTVTVYQNPVVSITGTNITCYGSNNGIAEATVTGGFPGYTYLWSNSFITQDVNNLAVGIYTVTVTDANNCTAMNTVTITAPPELEIITSPDQLICNGQIVPVSVTTTGGTGIYSYHWNTGATTQQIMVQPTINTTYSVFITDANGCVSTTSSTIVNVLPPLNIALFANQDSICPGNPISISALVSGGDGGPYFLYNSNNELIDNPYIVYPAGASNYIITAKDGCGTSIRDTLYIALYPVPDATFTADRMSGCVPLTVYFLPLEFQPGVQYLWNFEENQSLSTSATPAHTFESPGSYDITLTVQNQYGCSQTEAISHMINAYPVPTALINANPISVSILKPEIEFYNYSEGAINYEWSFGDGDSSNYISPVHNYAAPGNYIVELIAVSNHGCKDSTSMAVVVNDEFTFYAPNYFSPDGDGTNDVFKVFGYGIDNNFFKLYIYDRWGELIFISTDIEEGWNGYVGSKMSQNGTYTWLVNFKKISGVSVTKYGAANLIR